MSLCGLNRFHYALATHGLQIDLGIDAHLAIPDQVHDPLLTVLGRQVESLGQVAT